MKVYFVRHGQTEDGEREVQQGPEIPLSDAGKDQARKVAERFRAIKIDTIYASPYPRALDTARIINEIAGVEITTSPLLQELKRPTTIEGQSLRDPKIVALKHSMHENRNDPTWHHSNEENLTDLINRVSEFEKVLDKETRDVLVVSHAAVFKALTMLMLFKEYSSPDMFTQIYRHLRLTQAGITTVEKGSNGWLLLTWNDYTHLGDDLSESFYK